MSHDGVESIVVPIATRDCAAEPDIAHGEDR